MDTSAVINVNVQSNDTPQAQYKTVVLKPNMVDDVNTLTQAMLTAHGQNTKFVIKYDFTLGEDITVPANCVLEFDGGSILDDGTHTLTGTNTLLSGNIKCLVTIAGTFANDYLDVTWFGAIGDDDTDCIGIFHNVLGACIASKANMFIPSGIYAFKSDHFDISSGTASDDPTTFLDCKNIKIYGNNRNETILKQYAEGDVVNLAYVKNLEICDFAVTVDPNFTTEGESGINCVSLINICNINIHDIYAYSAFVVRHTSYPDGGKAFTVQSRITDNVKIYNCYARNCFYGFDVMIGGETMGRPNSNLEIHSCIAEKCQTGYTICTYSNEVSSGTPIIKGGLAFVQGKAINCMTTLMTQNAIGCDININAVNTEEISDLIKDANGNYWNPQNMWSQLGWNDLAVIIAYLDHAYHSNIKINASCNQINTGFRLEGNTNNTIQLMLNDDVDVESIYTTPSGSTYEGVVAGLSPSNKNNFFILNIPKDTNVNGFLEVWLRPNLECENYVVIDGMPFSLVSYVKKVYGHDDSNNHLGLAYMKANSGVFSFFNMDTSSPVYPAIKVGANDVEYGGLNAYGDLIRTSVTQGSPNYGSDANDIAGGMFVDVKNNASPTQNLGCIPVVKKNRGTTTERTNYDMTGIKSGYMWYDTTLNKPLWWDGTNWIDATGTTV